MEWDKANEKLERVSILSSLYDKLASQNPRLPEEAKSVQTEIKLTKVEMLKLVLSLRREYAHAEGKLDV